MDFVGPLDARGLRGELGRLVDRLAKLFEHAGRLIRLAPRQLIETLDFVFDFGGPCAHRGVVSLGKRVQCVEQCSCAGQACGAGTEPGNGLAVGRSLAVAVPPGWAPSGGAPIDGPLTVAVLMAFSGANAVGFFSSAATDGTLAGLSGCGFSPAFGFG